MISFNSKIVNYAAIGMAIYFFYQMNFSNNIRYSGTEPYNKEVFDTTARYTYKLDAKKPISEMNYFEKYLLEKFKDRNSSFIDDRKHVTGLDVTSGIPVKKGDKLYISITPEDSVYSENPAQVYVVGEEGICKQYENDILTMKTGDTRFLYDENKKQVSLKIIGIIKQEETNK